MIDSIQWYGHATFSIEGSPRVMIDPWSVVYDGPPPDVLLISHEHYDHCSPGDVRKLVGPNTLVIASRTAAIELDHLDLKVMTLRPWQVVNLGRTSIKSVPAYTFDGSHPAHREDLGFVISRNYTDIYYAGHTDFIPELKTMRCDIAILPLDEMPLPSAVEFVEVIEPRYVIPSHADTVSRLTLKSFVRELGELTEVVTLPPVHKASTLFAHS